MEFSLASVSPAVGRAGVQRCVWYGNEKLGVQVCSLKVLKTLYEWLENLRQTSDWRTWLKLTSDSRKWLKLTSSCNWRRIKLQVFWPLHIFFYCEWFVEILLITGTVLFQWTRSVGRIGLPGWRITIFFALSALEQSEIPFRILRSYFRCCETALI